MTLSEAEKEYHVERNKYIVLMEERRRINEAVEWQHGRKVRAFAQLNKLRELAK
jgi:hypothetical protein